MTFADESATWTSAGALGLAALLLALGIFLFWRWRRAAAREIAAVQESTARTERLVGEIRAALADAQEEGRRVALLGELGSTLDLDAALRRALEAVSELTGADAAHDRPPPGGGRADHRRLRALGRGVLARAHRPPA